VQAPGLSTTKKLVSGTDVAARGRLHDNGPVRPMATATGSAKEQVMNPTLLDVIIYWVFRVISIFLGFDLGY